MAKGPRVGDFGLRFGANVILATLLMLESINGIVKKPATVDVARWGSYSPYLRAITKTDRRTGVAAGAGRGREEGRGGQTDTAYRCGGGDAWR